MKHLWLALPILAGYTFYLREQGQLAKRSEKEYSFRCVLSSVDIKGHWEKQACRPKTMKGWALLTKTAFRGRWSQKVSVDVVYLIHQSIAGTSLFLARSWLARNSRCSSHLDLSSCCIQIGDDHFQLIASFRLINDHLSFLINLESRIYMHVIVIIMKADNTVLILISILATFISISVTLIWTTMHYQQK